MPEEHREDALRELEKPLYDDAEMNAELDSILARLEIRKDEWKQILSESPKQHTDYKTDRITTIVNKIRLKG